MQILKPGTRVPLAEEPNPLEFAKGLVPSEEETHFQIFKGVPLVQGTSRVVGAEVKARRTPEVREVPEVSVVGEVRVTSEVNETSTYRRVGSGRILRQVKVSGTGSA